MDTEAYLFVANRKMNQAKDALDVRASQLAVEHLDAAIEALLKARRTLL